MPQSIRDYCIEHADTIIVRDIGPKGKYESLSLSELPESTRERWIVRFEREGGYPARLLTPA